MRVLITGGSGFIGSAVVAAVLSADMSVRAVARNPAPLRRRFPTIEVVAMDLIQDNASQAAIWEQALSAVDAVVNAAGVLQTRRERDSWAVHRDAPVALFAACERAGVRRVVQVSAIGVEEADTVYARSKRAADDDLMARDLDWTVLRPAVVVGDGSYGGTSLLRGLAAFPFVVPTIGEGDTDIDFIHKDDLAAAIVATLRDGRAIGEVVMPAAAERLTLAGATLAYRRWLGLAPARLLKVPRAMVRGLARIGDVCRLDPVNSTAFAQFEARLTGEAAHLTAATGVRARGLNELLAARPAETQDLWHARLFLLRPAVRLVLACLWLVSGLAGLLAEPGRYIGHLTPMVSDLGSARAMAIGFSIADLAIALALVVGWRLRELAYLQFLLVAAYTALLTATAPALWAEPLGPLVKNLPILALIVVHRVVEQER